MGFQSGQTGKLFLDGSSTEAGKVVNWSFNATQQTLDTTSLADTDRTVIEGVRSISGSCRLYIYSDASTNGDATLFINKLLKQRTASGVPGSAAKQNATTAETATTLKLAYTDYQGTVKHITMPVVITSVNMSASNNEVMGADISFEANGAPTGLDL